jgi:DNA-binding NarL/FixJ family response regulator
MADAQVAAGLHEDAMRTAERCADLPVAGFPGAVNTALAGARARSELGLPFDQASITATSSGFANLRAAVRETAAIACEDPHDAVEHFRQAADGWCGVSARSSRRCQWSAADAALRAGDRRLAIGLLTGIDDTAPVWLRRRADATSRAAGGPAESERQATGHEVMVRVARGLTTKQIARALAVSPSTVETHVRRAMARHGASTRVQASIATLAESAGRREDVLLVRHPAGDRCITLAPSGHREPIDLDALPDAPWRLDGRLVRGVVRNDGDVSRVALARVRGAAFDLQVRCDAADEAELIEMLDRTGGARVVAERLGTIDPADVELLALLAGGATVRDIGSRLGYSPRTVQRRLAALRRQLGVATNREVIVASGIR